MTISTKKRNFYICMLLILLVQIFYYSNVILGQTYSDSNSYINWEPELCFRMFLYPLIIDFWQIIFPEYFSLGIVLTQIIISYLSLIFLYKTLCILEKGETNLALVILLFYGCSPAIISWNTIILSESLTLSLTVFFIYFTVRWLTYFENRSAIGIVVTCFLATMTKTAFFVYGIAIICLALLVLLCNKEKKKQTIFLLTLSVLLLLSFLIQCTYNYIHCGLFSMSYLSSRHSLVHALRTGLYLNHPDKQLVSVIDTIYTDNDYSLGYNTTSAVMALFGESWKEQNIGTSSFAKECLMTGPFQYFCDLAQNMVFACVRKFDHDYSAFTYTSSFSKAGINLLGLIFNPVRIGYGIILSLFGIFLSIKQWLKQRKCPFIFLGTSCGLILVPISTIAGAYSEWTRLMIYMLPFVYVLAIMLLRPVLNTILFKLKK